MKLQYPPQTNERCTNQCNCEPPIEMHLLKKEELLEKKLPTNIILIILSGACVLQIENTKSCKLTAGSMILLSPSIAFKCKSDKDTRLLIFSYETMSDFCNNLTITLPEESMVSSVFTDRILTVRTPIERYIKNLVQLIQDGINCYKFYRLKCTELTMLLHTYYSSNELIHFISPLVNCKHDFTSFIIANWQEVKTVKELVNISQYRRSSFDNKFKDIFGMPPHKWLTMKRAQKILVELTCENKTIKEICYDNRFNTVQQFNNFCRRYFDETPGGLKKRLSIEDTSQVAHIMQL